MRGAKRKSKDGPRVAVAVSHDERPLSIATMPVPQAAAFGRDAGRESLSAALDAGIEVSVLVDGRLAAIPRRSKRPT